MELDLYSTIVFDCDGVILDSNRVKTEAFRIAALPWGAEIADALVSYHKSHGGISRYRKFAYFLESILPRFSSAATPGIDGPNLDEMLATYALSVRAGLLTCGDADGLEELRAKTKEVPWCVVSGGDQNELREIFSKRGLYHFFDGGIFGSPDSKDMILAREIKSQSIKLPSLFLGDSRYDYEVAQRFGLDFLFLSGWSEFNDWEAFVCNKGIENVKDLKELLCQVA